MFGLFKKKPETFSFIGDPNDPWSGLGDPDSPTPSAFAQFAEPAPVAVPLHPLAEQFLNDYPDYNAGYNDDPDYQNTLFNVHDQLDEATAEIDQSQHSATWTDSDRSRLIASRQKELFYAYHLAKATEYYLERRSMFEAGQQWDANNMHKETLAAINRSAVAANALDAAGSFASAHPFLAGFFGTAIVHKLRGK
jgi:hypothetical protein